MDVKGQGRRGTVHGNQLYVLNDGKVSRRVEESISKLRLSTLLATTLKAKEEEKKVPEFSIFSSPEPKGIQVVQMKGRALFQGEILTK